MKDINKRLDKIEKQLRLNTIFIVVTCIWAILITLILI